MPVTTETTPLIPHRPQHRSVTRRLTTLVQAEGEPSWYASYKWMLSSWGYLLLVLVPLTFAADSAGWDAALRFSFSGIALIPLATLLGDATEQMSLSLGQTLAGLLNATFGNAVEIIVGITALLHNQIRIVQASMIGSILSKILLVLGCSFIAAGMKYRESAFGVAAAQTNGSLMTLACITIVVPAAYHSARISHNQPIDISVVTAEPEHTGLLIISRGAALLLLCVYIAYLFFQLKTHSDLFRTQPSLAFLSYEPGWTSAEAQGTEQEEPEEARMSVVAAGVALLVITVVTSFIADILVASIEETATRYNIPKAFIGLVLLPLVGNAPEFTTSVFMAMKGKMELTIGVCVGSSIQIALFVVPLLVTIGWVSGHDLTLFFDNFETVSFFTSVILVNMLIQDGKSNYMDGLMLVTLYLVFALAFWVS
ncbi:calcium/proton exchanger [Auriscalpium vulgare]|uniref:Calcium/proton exchanger n=1 Tax=Auriscalpium vulgare TaxID=40419 RepID=A0ACB8RM91_9AGAM|nr:calcium/proton exchanger [Auriscalpium vulgare]